jgi:uncharacterized protein YaiL (DUF2058 family)
MVKRDKKAEILTKNINASLAKTKDIHQLATQYKSTIDTVNVSFSDRNFGHYGPEAGLIGKIFAQKANQSLKLFKGDMGMYLVNVMKIDIPSSLQVDKNQGNSAEMFNQQQS